MTTQPELLTPSLCILLQYYSMTADWENRWPQRLGADRTSSHKSQEHEIATVTVSLHTGTEDWRIQAEYSLWYHCSCQFITYRCFNIIAYVYSCHYFFVKSIASCGRKLALCTSIPTWEVIEVERNLATACAFSRIKQFMARHCHISHCHENRISGSKLR